MTAKQDLDKFTQKIQKVLKIATDSTVMKLIGEKAINIIVKRTRMGYGVLGFNERKIPLKTMRKHSPEYAKARKKGRVKINRSLTSPKRVNLTLSGQMLESMAIHKISDASVTVGPKGYNDKGVANELIANVNAKRGWKFNNLTIPETKQIVRILNNSFIAALKKS